VLHKMFRTFPFLLAVVALTSIATTLPDDPTPDEMRWRLPPVSYPVGNEPTLARAELGERLFFDARISRTGNMACGSCHVPSKGWADDLPTPRGFFGKVLPRATPTIVNVAYGSIFMWDGRATSLEEQALLPINSFDEMGANSDEAAPNIDRVLRFIKGDAGYRRAFEASYPGEAVDEYTVAKAIAAFERTIVTTQEPFDRWLAGDRNAMSSQQIRGFRIFTDPEKGNCATCHKAPNFSDDGFHNTGLASYGHADPDLGRYAVTPVEANKGAFKTPGLRNVAATGPYFHDGSVTSLAEVVEFYAQGGIVKTNLSQDIKPLRLSPQDKADLVAFLNALTGDSLVDAWLPVGPHAAAN